MKKILLLMMTLIFLTGCTPKETNVSDGIFWIVTELSTSDGMNYQAEAALKSFQEKYPDVTVNLEILPTESTEREQYIQKLQTKILAGEGPDVYLLPTGDTIAVDANRKTHADSLTIEPLFRDVTQAMYTGVFSDIQEYYEKDVDLNTEGLRQEIMDAGMVGDARYVLPLRYNMPILLVNKDAASVKDLEQDKLGISNPFTDLVSYAVETNDTKLAIGLRMPNDFSVFPDLYDYEDGTVLLTQEEIAEYMSLYQNWYKVSHSAEEELLSNIEEIIRAHYDEMFHNSFPDVLEELGITISRDSLNSTKQYISSGQSHWTVQELPVFATSLNGLLENAILEQAMEQQWEEVPLLRSDGTIGAEVTYFGAVGASCDDAQMAYDYLRLFLTEDYQWDVVRPRTDRSHDNAFSVKAEMQNFGLVEQSWPVRDQGAIPYLFDTFLYRNVTHGRTSKEEGQRRAQIKAVETITEDSAIVLQHPITEARFPIYMEEENTLAYALMQLNDENGNPTNIDIDELAENVYQKINWHFAEG